MDNGGTTNNYTIDYSGYGCDEYIYNESTDDYSLLNCVFYNIGPTSDVKDGYYGYNGLECDRLLPVEASSGRVNLFECDNMTEHW